MKAVVVCESCGIPGAVRFNEDGTIKEMFFVCKCPRPTVEEANNAARASEASGRCTGEDA